MIESGVPFPKKPGEGGIKDIGFAADPDGYWIEIIKRGWQVNRMCNHAGFTLTEFQFRPCFSSPALTDTYFCFVRQTDESLPGPPSFQQTMIRVKDLEKSVAFYRDVCHMTEIDRLEFPEWKFTLSFMVQHRLPPVPVQHAACVYINVGDTVVDANCNQCVV